MGDMAGRKGVLVTVGTVGMGCKEADLQCFMERMFPPKVGNQLCQGRVVVTQGKHFGITLGVDVFGALIKMIENSFS